MKIAKDKGVEIDFWMTHPKNRVYKIETRGALYF